MCQSSIDPELPSTHVFVTRNWYYNIKIYGGIYVFYTETLLKYLTVIHVFCDWITFVSKLRIPTLPLSMPLGNISKVELK